MASRRLAALQRTADGRGAPVQRQLSMVELMKLPKENTATWKLLVGDVRYAEVIAAFGTAAEVVAFFASLRQKLGKDSKVWLEAVNKALGGTVKRPPAAKDREAAEQVIVEAMATLPAREGGGPAMELGKGVAAPSLVGGNAQPAPVQEAEPVPRLGAIDKLERSFNPHGPFSAGPVVGQKTVLKFVHENKDAFVFDKMLGPLECYKYRLGVQNEVEWYITLTYNPVQKQGKITHFGPFGAETSAKLD